MMESRFTAYYKALRMSDISKLRFLSLVEQLSTEREITTEGKPQV